MSSQIATAEPAHYPSDPKTGVMRVRGIASFVSIAGNHRMRKITLDAEWGVTADEAVEKMRQFREANSGSGFSGFSGSFTMEL